MLTDLVLPGQKIELQTVERAILGGASDKKSYISKVYDVLDDEQFEILMPMDKTKLILLPIDGEYDICFYTKQGLYQCDVRIIDRYKSNNVYILLCQQMTNLRKHQRREYYRFSCILDMQNRMLCEDEIKAIEDNRIFFQSGLALNNSSVVDISGGGIRFVTNGYQYEVGDEIYLTYKLPIGGHEKQYEISGKILAVRALDNKPNAFEHRLQYINLEKTDREEIIRYIFEEERKKRQRKNDR